jgi:Na+-transporting NADH:ubiquinone oxidoreductase subunit C
MALNKESNGYTFGFAAALVVIVGTILALLATGLKDKQDQNVVVKKKIDILSAMLTQAEMESISRENADSEFENYVNLNEAVVLNETGQVMEGVSAFEANIRKEYKDKTLANKNRSYPLFIGQKDGKPLYIIPIVGKGLWGPIWGYICMNEDMQTIQGASFGHQGETPGLGAEITQPFFVNSWIGEKISDEDGEFLKFEIVKDGSGVNEEQKVDGITGGTITSKGVEEMANRCLAVYAKYFKSKKS